MDEVRERRALRQGKVTPLTCTMSLVQAAEDGRIKSLVVVVKLTDDTIQTVWSDVPSLEALGLLECGKDDVMQVIKE